MNDKELTELIDLLYPHFLKRLKAEGIIKNSIRSTNATVTWVDITKSTNIGDVVKVKFPYEATEISMLNKSTAELSVGDLVCVHYYIDLKNAYVAYKV